MIFGVEKVEHRQKTDDEKIDSKANNEAPKVE